MSRESASVSGSRSVFLPVAVPFLPLRLSSQSRSAWCKVCISLWKLDARLWELFLPFFAVGFCFSAGFCLAPCCRFLSFSLRTKWVMGSWRVQIAVASGGGGGFFFRLVLGCYSCGCTRCACVDMSTLHFQIISD